MHGKAIPTGVACSQPCNGGTVQAAAWCERSDGVKFITSRIDRIAAEAKGLSKFRVVHAGDPDYVHYEQCEGSPLSAVDGLVGSTGSYLLPCRKSDAITFAYTGIDGFAYEDTCHCSDSANLSAKGASCTASGIREDVVLAGPRAVSCSVGGATLSGNMTCTYQGGAANPLYVWQGEVSSTGPYTYGACQGVCGTGTRTVTCQYDKCTGSSSTSCPLRACTGGSWSVGSCSESCGGGTRTVSCQHDSCSGARPSTSCNTQACEPSGSNCTSWRDVTGNNLWVGISGVWTGDWSDICSRHCRGTTFATSRPYEQYHERTCTTNGVSKVERKTVSRVYSDSAYEGCKTCSDTQTQTQATGAWTVGRWSSCNASCGGGSQTRSVTCQYDGCTGVRPSSSRSCNTQACSVDCQGYWGDWPRGRCTTHTGFMGGCGLIRNTSQTRDFIVTRSPSGGGKACPTRETRLCYYCAACFISGTFIEMENGDLKPIEEVKVGERVRGGDGVVNTVLEVRINPYTGKFYSMNGSDNFVTGGHPFKTTEGWKAFDVIEAVALNPDLNITQLKIGDILLTDKGFVRLDTVNSEDKKGTTVYNLHLDGTQEYYADGFLVHNK